MQVQNFECQIAKAQIGRYVAGDKLSDEAIEQLEAHVGKCPECKQNLAERRAALQAMLSLGQADAPSQQAASPRGKFDLADFIKSKVRAGQPVQAVAASGETKPASFTKPALYSLALGAVLIGMSFASKNLGSVLGPTAAETTSPKEAPKAVSTPASKPVPEKSPDPLTKVQAGASTLPTGHPAVSPAPVAKAPKPAPKISSEPKPVHSHKHRSPRPTQNSIRVYEPEN